MATALFPKKKTFVTYGRRSAGSKTAGSSGRSATSRPPQAAIVSLSAESSKEDLETEVTHDDAKSSDDELPSIASISNATRPAGSQARRARVPEVVVSSGSARKPSAKALGKRRMQEPILDGDEASIALDSSGSPPPATAKAPRRTPNAMDHAADQSAGSSPDSRTRSPSSKRRKMASPTTTSTALANKGRDGRSEAGHADDNTAKDAETSGRASSSTSRTPGDRQAHDKPLQKEKDASEDIPPDLLGSASNATKPTLSISAPSSPHKIPVAPDLHSPARTERPSVYSMSPPPSPPDLPIPPEDEALGFGFDDLLGGPSTSLDLPTARSVSKRKPLVRHMSARSDIDSDAGSSAFGSPQRSVGERSRAGSESYFGMPTSPRKTLMSPSRGLKATTSAPELDPGHIFNQVSRPGTPDGSQEAPRPARPPASPPAGIKRTYGQNRTILAEVGLTESQSSLQAASRPGLKAMRYQSTDSLSGRFGFQSHGNSPAPSDQGDNDEAEDEEEDLLDSQSDLHNINQLRSAGDNRRFTDEMNYMLDGFDANQPLNVQRTSAIEIIRKLRDEEWVRRLRTYDCVLQVYDRFLTVKAGEGDRILGTCLVIFISRLIQDARSVELILNHSSASDGCINLLLRILQTKWAKSDLETPDRNLNKAEARMLNSLHHVITWDQKDKRHKISVRFLIFNILAGIAMHKLPSPHTPRELVFNTGFLDSIVDTLRLDLPASVENGFPDSDTVEIDLCLRLLESAAADMYPNEADAVLDNLAPKLSRGIVVLVAVAEMASFSDDDPEDLLAAAGLLTSALRLLVTACTVSQAWAEAAAASKTPLLQHLIQIAYLTRHAEPSVPIQASANDGDTSTQSSVSTGTNEDTPPCKQFDLLCLSLGLLESLLDNVESARAVFRTVQLAQSSAVACIVDLYADLKPRTDQVEKQLLAKLSFLILLHTLLGDSLTQEQVGKALQDSKIEVASFVEDLKGLQIPMDNDNADTEGAKIQNELRLAVAKLGTFVD